MSGCKSLEEMPREQVKKALSCVGSTEMMVGSSAVFQTRFEAFAGAMLVLEACRMGILELVPALKVNTLSDVNRSSSSSVSAS